MSGPVVDARDLLVGVAMGLDVAEAPAWLASVVWAVVEWLTGMVEDRQ